VLAYANVAILPGVFNVLFRVIGLLGLLAFSLATSGCTSCGKLDQFQAPTLPKLCHADTAPNWSDCRTDRRSPRYPGNAGARRRGSL